jgi:hypothetical protein
MSVDGRTIRRFKAETGHWRAREWLPSSVIRGLQ